LTDHADAKPVSVDDNNHYRVAAGRGGRIAGACGFSK
jgi:hypothetical protein